MAGGWDAAIGAALDFTEEELELNRGRRLSDRQRAWLRARRSFGGPKLKLATGPADTRIRGVSSDFVGSVPSDAGYGFVRYELRIGSELFFVGDKSILGMFTDGVDYRGYYIGRGETKVLVSIERARPSF